MFMWWLTSRDEPSLPEEWQPARGVLGLLCGDSSSMADSHTCKRYNGPGSHPLLTPPPTDIASLQECSIRGYILVQEEVTA